MIENEGVWDAITKTFTWGRRLADILPRPSSPRPYPSPTTLSRHWSIVKTDDHDKVLREVAGRSCSPRPAPSCTPLRARNALVLVGTARRAVLYSSVNVDARAAEPTMANREDADGAASLPHPRAPQKMMTGSRSRRANCPTLKVRRPFPFAGMCGNRGRAAWDVVPQAATLPTLSVRTASFPWMYLPAIFFRFDLHLVRRALAFGLPLECNASR